MNPEYERVGDAIADVMFSSAAAGRPVYALPDEATLSAVLDKAGIEGEGAAALGKVVSHSLNVDVPGTAPFHAHATAAVRHRQQPLEVPPALPLLVLLALAAEQMHADGELAAHNYYSRLHRLLGLPAECHTRVENSYRKTADLLWGSLNAWLEAWEGERGIPTAYAVGSHAFIGLPMSQAVIRQHDRGGLHELFALEGLTPGLRVSPTDMGALMDPYATATPSPLSSHLARLWRVPAARERIVDAACLELEAWDGAGVDVTPSGRQVAATRLLAFLRRFPRKSFEINLLLPYRSEQPGVARFTSPSDEVQVPTVVGPGGSTRLSGIGGVSAASLVDAQLEGMLGEGESQPFERRPKRVTPLRWDDLQGAYVEVERISLCEDSIVLARSDTRTRVEHYLATHARPGWAEVTAAPGVPDGWLVYERVQVVSVPSGQVHIDLLPLVPRARTSLTLRGGFVLPGLLRKWSALEPPEVVAVAAGAAKVEVKVFRGTRADPDQLMVRKSWEGELVVLPLTDQALPDGEYVAAMFVDGSNKAASTALLRLRSASSPQFRVEEVDIRLVYSPGSSSVWPLSAGHPLWPAYVNGAQVRELEGPSADQRPMAEYAPRPRAAGVAKAPAIRVGIPMPGDSCLVTGMHRFHLPPVLPGQVLTRSIEGECETCGLVRRFAGTQRAAKKKDKSRSIGLAPLDVPSVAESSGPSLDVAFDALSHVGAGSLGAFERIAAQVEGSGLFADSFLRRLEVAGHLDVARDEYLRVTEWALNSSTLVPVAEGRWVLIGSRSRRLLDDLRDRLGVGGQVICSVDAQLARVEVVGRLPSGGLADLGVQVVEESSALRIASALPRLSTLADSLKRVAVPSYRSAEFWDTASASWQHTEALTRTGAYRLKDFGSTYGVRSVDDIEQGTIGIGNAQLVKHIANLWADDPLVGYHAKSNSVLTPLGADLPALYGRALALGSGSAPRELVKDRVLQYKDVPRIVADIIFDRVSR